MSWFTALFGGSPSLGQVGLLFLAATLIWSIGRLSGSRPGLHPKSPPLTDGVYPVIGAFRFFTRRWDFFKHAAAASPTGNFSFYVGNKPVVGLTSDATRQVFFDNKHFGFAEGYGGLAEGFSVLFGPSSSSSESSKDGDGKPKPPPMDFSKYFNSRMIRVLRTDVLQRNLPTLIADTQARLGELVALAEDNKSGSGAGAGITDPFESIYKAVFQLTMRTVGCNDLAEDMPLMSKMLHWYVTVEKTTSPVAVMYPWIPTYAMIKRTVAGMRLFTTIKKIGDERLRTGSRSEDAMQILIDQGDEMGNIVGFTVAALFAAQLNSGINAAWVLVFLTVYPEWMARARAEVTAAIERNSATLSVDGKERPLLERLASLPLEAWETDFPVLDWCLRDCIRLTATGATFRQNISGKDIVIGDEVVPKDSYVAYPMNGTHQDPTIYKDPTRWDPGRYAEDRAEDKKKPYAYLGWGAGRHPCLGMRFAKLEQNIIVAFFIMMFDYDLCDQKGNIVSTPTPIDLNAFSASKPDPKVYLRYKVRK